MRSWGGRFWNGLSPLTASPQLQRALIKASMSGKKRSFREEETEDKKFKVNKVALHMNLAEKSFQEKYPSLEADKPPGDLTSSIVVFSP